MLNKKEPEKASIKPRERFFSGRFKTKMPTKNAGKKSKAEINRNELIIGVSSTK
jgi:hypothetical protein